MTRIAWLLAAVLLPASEMLAATVTLTPTKDNTLFESATGDVSDGAGETILVGKTGSSGGSQVRRGTIAFNLALIPAGATVTGVTLTLYLSRIAANFPGSESISLYELNANWGQGASFVSKGIPVPAEENDATWLYRFYPDTTRKWTTPGGDFDPVASASTTVTAAGRTYSWSSAALIQDVQGWLNAPATNFGWIIRGDESNLYTAVTFYSTELSESVNRPHLTITYDTVPEPAAGALLVAGGWIAATRRRRGVCAF